jgi:hypothetical protein
MTGLLRRCVILPISLFLLTAKGFGQAPPDLNSNALTILQQNCGNLGCHGGPDPYSFDIRDPASLLAARVIQSGNASGSELIRRLEAGIMPLGGYKGQRGVKLPAEDIQILREWIDAGGPESARLPRTVQRQFISESRVLAAILRDLVSTPEADRPYLRYYSLANLWNSSDVEESELELYRMALSKLVNHLSWKREITQPKQLGFENTILRIDLRNYGWTAGTWREIIASYPYGLERPELSENNRVQALSGVSLPCIRVDWFIANASTPPLYHTILRLPGTLDKLESLLQVDATFDIEQNLARRFGLRNSGVSRNNRAMERHSTVYGAYWKSFDFAGNNPAQNIFRDPLDLRADGGEIIFNLPNGLQAYFIADRQGNRIDAAPVNIVRDRTNPDDPVVHNGRSCMGCHVRGMNVFRDEISGTLRARPQALFNLDRADALYPGQPELERLLELDNIRFSRALDRTGSRTTGSTDDEPISRVARKYESSLTVSQAAADLFIEDPEELQKLIENSTPLQIQGFDQLLGPKGGIKRDSWEQGFGTVARELGIGEFFSPRLRTCE